MISPPEQPPPLTASCMRLSRHSPKFQRVVYFPKIQPKARLKFMILQTSSRTDGLGRKAFTSADIHARQRFDQDIEDITRNLLLQNGSRAEVALVDCVCCISITEFVLGPPIKSGLTITKNLLPSIPWIA